MDGCSSLKVPDHARNRGRLGKLRNKMGPAGYPTLTLMALMETGTRGMLGATFGPPDAHETVHASRLLHLLNRDMLLLTASARCGPHLWSWRKAEMPVRVG
ncbi:hypothetical protein HD597_007056 [Nonomuraea thailandensis]|uniref:Uncharacterized protein n=1 Tax=Nonomuraea thailandensis TaxID=1188745 RepID=A0A9X2GJI5_9ACTN|nr:hypothetical protein [Nonomuraea thailandensis]